MKNFKGKSSMEQLNNYELNDKALGLSIIHTSYRLARMLIEKEDEYDTLMEKYNKLNEMFEQYLIKTKNLQTELDRLKMQETIDATKIQFELEY